MTEAAEGARGTELQIRVHLDELLFRRKMTIVELSERTGIHQTNLSRVKNGHALALRLDTLLALCLALDCQPGDLLTCG